MKLLTLPFGLFLALFISLGAALPQAAASENFGRLFSRPSERQNLDILRQYQQLKVVTPQDNLQLAPSADAAPVALPAPITLQGFVKRSDGASTLWINNKAVQENSTVDNVEIGRLNKRAGSTHAGTDSLNIRIPANGKRIRLKAGQAYDPETNQIKELKLLEKEKRLRLEETGVIGHEVSP